MSYRSNIIFLILILSATNVFADSLDDKVRKAKTMLEGGGELSAQYLKAWNGSNVYGKPLQVVSQEDSTVAASFVTAQATGSSIEARTLAKIDRKTKADPFDIVVRPTIKSEALAMVVPHEISHIENRIELEALLDKNPIFQKLYYRAQIALARNMLSTFEKTNPEDAANILKVSFCEEFNAFQIELRLSKEGLPIQQNGVVARAMKPGSQKTIGRILYEAYIQPHNLRAQFDVKNLEDQCRRYKNTAEMAAALFGGQAQVSAAARTATDKVSGAGLN